MNRIRLIVIFLFFCFGVLQGFGEVMLSNLSAGASHASYRSLDLTNAALPINRRQALIFRTGGDTVDLDSIVVKIYTQYGGHVKLRMNIYYRGINHLPEGDVLGTLETDAPEYTSQFVNVKLNAQGQIRLRPHTWYVAALELKDKTTESSSLLYWGTRSAARAPEPEGTDWEWSGEHVEYNQFDFYLDIPYPGWTYGSQTGKVPVFEIRGTSVADTLEPRSVEVPLFSNWFSAIRGIAWNHESNAGTGTVFRTGSGAVMVDRFKIMARSSSHEKGKIKGRIYRAGGNGLPTGSVVANLSGDLAAYLGPNLLYPEDTLVLEANTRYVLSVEGANWWTSFNWATSKAQRNFPEGSAWEVSHGWLRYRPNGIPQWSLTNDNVGEPLMFEVYGEPLIPQVEFAQGAEVTLSAHADRMLMDATRTNGLERVVPFGMLVFATNEPYSGGGIRGPVIFRHAVNNATDWPENGHFQITEKFTLPESGSYYLTMALVDPATNTLLDTRDLGRMTFGETHFIELVNEEVQTEVPSIANASSGIMSWDVDIRVNEVRNDVDTKLWVMATRSRYLGGELNGTLLQEIPLTGISNTGTWNISEVGDESTIAKRFVIPYELSNFFITFAIIERDQPVAWDTVSGREGQFLNVASSNHPDRIYNRILYEHFGELEVAFAHADSGYYWHRNYGLWYMHAARGISPWYIYSYDKEAWCFVTNSFENGFWFWDLEKSDYGGTAELYWPWVYYKYAGVWEE